MEIKPVKTKKQYQEWLRWVDEQFDKKIKPNSARLNMFFKYYLDFLNFF